MKDVTLKKGVKQETHSKNGQAHSCGSVLQFLITVIGDWLSSLHSTEAHHVPDPRCWHLFQPTVRLSPSQTSAT